MKHPEIVLLPMLMLADYFLTVLGAIGREGKYGEHFKTEHYELNPAWQKQISRKQWFSPRHVLFTVLISATLATLLELGDVPDLIAEAVFGCLFVVFAAVIGRHLSNLLVFRRLVRSPAEIAGQVTMTHALSLSISAYQYLVLVVPLGIIAVFSPTPFVLGGLAGAALIVAVHFVWIQRHKKKNRQPE